MFDVKFYFDSGLVSEVLKIDNPMFREDIADAMKKGLPFVINRDSELGAVINTQHIRIVDIRPSEDTETKKNHEK